MTEPANDQPMAIVSLCANELKYCLNENDGTVSVDEEDEDVLDVLLPPPIPPNPPNWAEEMVSEDNNMTMVAKIDFIFEGTFVLLVFDLLDCSQKRLHFIIVVEIYGNATFPLVIAFEFDIVVKIFSNDFSHFVI